MHVTVTPALYSAGDLIGFTTGMVITVLLLVLTLRAAKLPGTPRANIVFAVCAFLWSTGGLVHAAVAAAGLPFDGGWALGAEAVQLSGAAAFPIPVLAIWQPFAVLPWQKTAARVLWICACLTAAAIAAPLWARAFWGASAMRNPGAMHLTAYNAALLLLLGAIVSLRRESAPRPVYLPSLAIVCAVSGAAIAVGLAQHSHAQHAALGNWFAATGAHLVLLVLLCGFLLFARFRYADVFIRYGVRILLAGAWAATLTAVAQSWSLLQMAHRTPSPAAAHVFLVILFVNVLLLSFTFMDERISTRINRWLFHAPDYRVEARQLGNSLRHLQSEAEITAAVEDAARRPLELNGARVMEAHQLPLPRWPAGVLEGETVEIGHNDAMRDLLPLPNVEVLIPIASGGRVTHVLLVAPGSTRPGLVTHDLNYLATVATQCGARLDALGREREAAERQSREALLLQQVTEAELRALRAQVNPHFLFNSLNTIADQIVRDPSRAEAMTLRLASVFRHVLAHSSRPLTSIRDEIAFLRTYLYIEEARFGDRLQVDFDIAPEIAGEHIPSLILQPLVENALKHGLGPKPGPGHLWISARAQDGSVSIRVEDDGLGPSLRSGSQGLGLANIAERLSTLYHDRGRVTLEAREGGGSCATVLIPRGEAAAAP
ncbi:MAG TPA: histidine kinase [Bryobacteraceae bacterium]